MIGVFRRRPDYYLGLRRLNLRRFVLGAGAGVNLFAGMTQYRDSRRR